MKAKKAKQYSWRLFKRQWQLHLLVALPVLYLVIFHFIPM